MSAPDLSSGEEVLWQRELTQGVFRKTIVEIQRITNYTISQNQKWMGLGRVEDIVITNRHSVSNSQGTGVIAGRYGARTVMGSNTSKSHQVGDISFIYEGKPYITFRQVPDPNGLTDLVKAAVKTAKKIADS